MRIAIVHYHARRGGVTRVMQHAAGVLREAGHEPAILLGEQPPDEISFPAPVEVVAGLGYDDGNHFLEDPVTLGEQVRAAASRALGGSPDIWHIHNHSLGKNRSWPNWVSAMAQSGEKLALQIHDFAEDGRPANYRHLGDGVHHLYPFGPHVLYVLLNRRDYHFLRAAGFPESRLTVLPNAVQASDAPKAPLPEEKARPFLLYPTRAIRRKNIGEFLLWAAVDQRQHDFGITLAPESRGEVERYRRWKTFAHEQSLPVEFEMGLSHDFATLVQQSRALVTTSVAEGFGLAFLEPWMAGRPLIGRDLPDITAGFKESGLVLDHMYDELTVPQNWVNMDRLRGAVRASMTGAYEAFGRKTTPGDIEHAIHAACPKDRIAFGRLDEALQEEVIVRAAQEGPDALAPSFPGSINPMDEKMETNRAVVKEKYGLSQYRERLLALYQRVYEMRDDLSGFVPAAQVLDQFLSPERFCLLRS